MLSLTSTIGSRPTGGSSPVIAVSCSSTSQPSYPCRASASSTEAIPASPRPSGTNGPCLVADSNDSSPDLLDVGGEIAPAVVVELCRLRPAFILDDRQHQHPGAGAGQQRAGIGREEPGGPELRSSQPDRLHLG